MVDTEVEGITAFPSPGEASYRYAILLKSGKVNIWLEDRTSKKQWQTGFLSKEDYVTHANIFVDALPEDYLSCFKQCLDCSLEGKGEAQRKLTPGRSGNLKMEFEVKIRLLHSERTVKYEFALQPLHVERIDILESKLKDQHEELEKLRHNVDRGDASVSLYVESLVEQDTTEWRKSKLQWKNVASANFVLSEDKKAIAILRPGLYAAAVLVNHVSCTNGGIGFITLEKDGVAIQHAVTVGSASRSKVRGVGEVILQDSTSIVCIFQAEKGEEISVACSDTSPISTVSSYLTLVQIGV